MLLSIQELEASCVPLPEVTQFFAENPHRPADWNDVASVRTSMSAAVAAFNATLPPAPDIVESEITIAMRDGYLSTAKVRKPLSPPRDASSPLIILAFGGGFIAGDRHQMAVEARAFVRLFDAVVVNISYRLAPENKFPVGWDDAWDSIKWAVANGSSLGADPQSGVILGGTSAGANLAAVCARRAQVEKLESEITGVWLNVPSVLPRHCVPERWRERHVSMQQNENADVFPAHVLRSVNRHSGWDEDSPWRSPVNSNHPLKGLPKTFIQVDGMDCLRDDGLLYDELLKEAGVESRCVLYPGCPHAHATFLPGTQVAAKALVDVMQGVGWMLSKTILADEAGKALDPPSDSCYAIELMDRIQLGSATGALLDPF